MGMNSFAESVELITTLLRIAALFLSLVILWFAIYIFELLQKQKKVSPRRCNNSENLSKDNLYLISDTSSDQLKSILKVVDKNSSLISNFELEENNLSFRQISFDSRLNEKSEFESSNTYKDDCKKGNTYQLNLRALTSPKLYESGVLFLVAIGGVSFLFLDRTRSSIDYVLPVNRSNTDNSTQAKITARVEVGDSSIVTTGLRRKQFIPIPAESNRQLTHFPSNDLLKPNRSNEVSKKLKPTYSDADLLLRRLMFALTPEEYGSLIPTSLEIEWYGLGPI